MRACVPKQCVSLVLGCVETPTRSPTSAKRGLKAYVGLSVAWGDLGAQIFEDLQRVYSRKSETFNLAS